MRAVCLDNNIAEIQRAAVSGEYRGVLAIEFGFVAVRFAGFCDKHMAVISAHAVGCNGVTAVLRVGKGFVDGNVALRKMCASGGRRLCRCALCGGDFALRRLRNGG